MDGDTVQAIGILAATMVALLGMLWGVMALVTKTVVQQVEKWQQGIQTQLGDFKTDIDKRFDGIDKRFDDFKADVDKRFDSVTADIATLRTDMNTRLDKQTDQITDVRNQVAVLSERMARVEERVGIPAEPIVTA